MSRNRTKDEVSDSNKVNETSYSKGRSGKPNRKQRRDFKKEVVKEVKKGIKNSKFNQAGLDEEGRNNKPGYYFVDQKVAEQVTQLVFNNVLGWGSIHGYEVPTIMRIDLVANPGCTYDIPAHTGPWDHTFVNSPSESENLPYANPAGKAGVNLMASKLYTLLSSFTGRTSAYAPQDVAIMILAIAGIAEYSEAIRRIFGIALTYNYWNRTLARGLITSMKVDADDFFANSSIYRSQFNIAMSRINQIPLLDNIAFIQKSREIYQDIYYDDPTNMSQIFYYMPKTWTILDETTDEGGSVLRHISHGDPQDDSAQGVSVGTMINNLNKMITAVLESSTLNFIYADMLNMANKIKTPMWKFDYLAENYTVLPVYNRNACLQLHNLKIAGFRTIGTLPLDWDPDPEIAHNKKVLIAYNGEYYTEGFDVFCDPDRNDIVYNPGFAFMGPTYPECHSTMSIVDLDTDSPTLEDRIETLRFTSLWGGYWKQVNGQKYAIYMALPDHFATNIAIYKNIEDSIPAAISYSNYADNLSGNDRLKHFFTLATQWENAPVNLAVDPTEDEVSLVYGDLSYYTTVDFEYVKRLINAMSVGLYEFRV